MPVAVMPNPASPDKAEDGRGGLIWRLTEGDGMSAQRLACSSPLANLLGSLLSLFAASHPPTCSVPTTPTSCSAWSSTSGVQW